MVIVVKVGGSILGEGVDPSTVEDISRVMKRESLVLVHGGGREVTTIGERMGKEQKFIVSPGGVRSRFTDKETSSIYTMVMSGKINKEIVAALQKVGLGAVGFSGVDGRILAAKRKKKLIVMDGRGRRRIVDGGYTGKIHTVNTELITLLLDNGYLPVISPVALSEDFEFLNVDGDRAAAFVAGNIGATKVLFLTDVTGILEGEKLIRALNLNRAKKIMKKVGFGMEKKVMACVEALEMGVRETIVASGLVRHPISAAISGKSGTVIRH